MNIKIFTFHYTNNYGALLQGLCLKEFLRENFNLKLNSQDIYQKKFFDWIKLSKEYLTNSINKSGLIK